MIAKDEMLAQVPERVGVETLLRNLVQETVRDSAEIVSLAVSDHQGLPILDATRGSISVMTFTATATMAIRTARTAAEAVGLEPPEHVTVHCPSGVLVIMEVPGTGASVIALLRSDANLGLALVVLRRLQANLSAALQE